MNAFGKRIQAFRNAINLSQEQLHYATGISQSHIARIELAQLNTSISHLSLLAEFFGVEEHELLNFNKPIPDGDVLKKNVIKYLKVNGIEVESILKPSATHILATKILASKFLNTPKYTSELVEHISEKYEIHFGSSQISTAMEILRKKGSVEKIYTTKKSKFQYIKAKASK
jgi:transcriptional regulator with XRE-family HTH domain